MIIKTEMTGHGQREREKHRNKDFLQRGIVFPEMMLVTGQLTGLDTVSAFFLCMLVSAGVTDTFLFEGIEVHFVKINE